MKKKIVSVCLVVCLLATAIIGTTLAYFTDTAKVTNTFTVGKVDITLDEARVDLNGKEIVGEGAGRVQENTYKLYPGKSYDKDPTITVAADSEDCYLFVKVVNGLAELEAAGDTTIAKQMENNGWAVYGDYYYYVGTIADENYDKDGAVVSAGDKAVVFETFTIDTAETAATLAEPGNVVITAYAVQAEGFDTAQVAWTSAHGDLFPDAGT